MTPKRVADAIERRLGLDAPPVRISVIIQEVLHLEFNKSRAEAADFDPKLIQQVAEEIAVREVEHSDGGGSPTVRLVGVTQDSVAGFCHPLAGEDAEVIQARIQRSNLDDLLNSIRSLSFNDFELFGARFLRELGAETATVTRQAGDQGIDFFGLFSFGQLHPAPEKFRVLAKDVHLLFVGQAKHYPTRSIGPSTVRELIGAVSLARTKTQSNDGVDVFGDLPLRPFSPVVALLFTTGEITAGARKLAEAAGIVAKTGVQLAVFLADRGVGLAETDAGAIYSQGEFDRWLRM